MAWFPCPFQQVNFSVDDTLAKSQNMHTEYVIYILELVALYYYTRALFQIGLRARRRLMWEAEEALFPDANRIPVRIRHRGGIFNLNIPQGAQFRVNDVIL